MRAVFLDYCSLAADGLDMSGLAKLPVEFIYFQHGRPGQTLERIEGADIVLTNKVVLDRTHFEACPQLKKVVILATGTNNVDLDAACEFGVSVSNIVDYSTNSVVQHVFAMLLAIKTSLISYDRDVKAGQWQQSPFFGLLDYPINEISGLTMGIVGYGKIGSAVADVARAFGMNVLVAQSLVSEARQDRVSLDVLLQQSDVVSLHCPLSPKSENLIGKTELLKMKQGAILLNLARGGIVNEQALLEVLKQGHLAGAGVDVLCNEPPADGDVLLTSSGLDNLVVTPHIGWASRQARQNLVGQVLAILEAFLSGQQLNAVVMNE